MASLSHRRYLRCFEKNFLRIFFNPASGVTTPQEAPYETTGNSVEVQRLIVPKLNIASTSLSCCLRLMINYEQQR